jgi:hypothetical protein
MPVTGFANLKTLSNIFSSVHRASMSACRGISVRLIQRRVRQPMNWSGSREEAVVPITRGRLFFEDHCVDNCELEDNCQSPIALDGQTCLFEVMSAMRLIMFVTDLGRFPLQSWLTKENRLCFR